MATPEERRELARLFGTLLPDGRTIAAGALVKMLSLERGWYPPAAARRIVRWALAEGVLAGSGEELRLAGPVEPVGLDYRPPGELAERAPPEAGTGDGHGGSGGNASRAASGDPFATLLDRLAARGLPRDELLAAFNDLPERTRELLAPEAALLVVAAGRGIDVATEAAELSARLEKRSANSGS